jgi:ATP-dependent Zn protease
MKDVFSKAGIEVTSENKREVDKIIHSIVDIQYKNCSKTWKEVKKKLAEDEEAFISMLKAKMNKV